MQSGVNAPIGALYFKQRVFVDGNNTITASAAVLPCHPDGYRGQVRHMSAVREVWVDWFESYDEALRWVQAGLLPGFSAPDELHGIWSSGESD